MADLEITYNGSKIVELSESGNKTLKTSGKYCEGDISVAYTKASGGGVHEYVFTPSTSVPQVFLPFQLSQYNNYAFTIEALSEVTRSPTVPAITTVMSLDSNIVTYLGDKLGFGQNYVNLPGGTQTWYNYISTLSLSGGGTMLDIYYHNYYFYEGVEYRVRVAEL